MDSLTQCGSSAYRLVIVYPPAGTNGDEKYSTL